MTAIKHGPRAGEVAKAEFGRTRDWLTRLERIGVIPPAPRDFAGFRFYPPDYLEKIKPLIAAASRSRKARGPVPTRPRTRGTAA